MVKLGLVTPLQLMAEVAGLVAEDLIQIGHLTVNGHDVEIPVDPRSAPGNKAIPNLFSANNSTSFRTFPIILPNRSEIYSEIIRSLCCDISGKLYIPQL